MGLPKARPQSRGLRTTLTIKAAEGTNDDVAKWRACAARELAIWTQKTNEALKKVEAGGFADVIKAVKDSQKTFAASRDRFCVVFDKIEPGMYKGDASYCRLRETANRSLSLIKLGAAVNEH
ncbi:lysozyme inhibitor LprI family protein [Rhodopseudomonas sp. RCAM05734]|uniref:lysozyme inhibitor LprI family protein n=1 Tax=Rhodopseudomonas sp. RCAM05734 TaxID=3457549 RepID=UPI0040449668